LTVGIDLGLTEFLATSEGNIVPNPKYGKRSAKRLAQAQRKLEARKKAEKERVPCATNPKTVLKRKTVVAKIHKQVVNQRTDFFHKTANTLVGEYGYIFAEDLKPSEMTSYRVLNRTLYDTAWAGFLSILSAKAAEAGREFRKVDPAYTSQDCSGCCHRQKMPLVVRTYVCPNCGLVLSRDVNAARNIERLGLESLARSA
jgi:putative transposase